MTRSARSRRLCEIAGHQLIAHPPSQVDGLFWVLTINGRRWGDGQAQFFVLANNFHEKVVPTLAPIGAEAEDKGRGAIEAAQARVRERKLQSRALDDAARAAGIEVCPKAVFGIEPVPTTHEQIKERGEAFADLVRRYRNLHQIELWAAGKRSDFPSNAAYEPQQQHRHGEQGE